MPIQNHLATVYKRPITRMMVPVSTLRGMKLNMNLLAKN